MGFYYDKQGKQISAKTWGLLLNDVKYRVVKQTKLQGTDISTVWLGINHNYFGDAPIIFETMIFSDLIPKLHNWQDRYSTLEEAQKGHEKAVALVKKHLPKKGRRIILKGDL